MNKKLEREILDYASNCVDYLEQTRSYLPMNSHDWKDVKQEILIRVARGLSFLDRKKTYKGYIRKIVNNTFKNQIRDRSLASNPDSSLRKAKFAVKNASSIRTKVIQNGILGEEIIYEPDFIALDNTERNRITDMLDTLSENEQLVLKVLSEENSWTEGSKRLKWSYSKFYNIGQSGISKLKSLSKTF